MVSSPSVSSRMRCQPAASISSVPRSVISIGRSRTPKYRAGWRTCSVDAGGSASTLSTSLHPPLASAQPVNAVPASYWKASEARMISGTRGYSAASVGAMPWRRRSMSSIVSRVGVPRCT